MKQAFLGASAQQRRTYSKPDIHSDSESSQKSEHEANREVLDETDALMSEIDEVLEDEIELDAADLLMKADALGIKQAFGNFCENGAMCGNTAIKSLQ